MSMTDDKSVVSVIDTDSDSYDDYYEYDVKCRAGHTEIYGFYTVTGEIIRGSSEKVVGTLKGTMMENPIICDMENESNEFADLAAAALAESGSTLTPLEMMNSTEFFSSFLEDCPDMRMEYCYRVFLVEKLNVLPKYHGKKLGLALLKRALKIICPGPGSIAFVKPFPLQYEVLSNYGISPESLSSTEYKAKWGNLTRESYDAALKKVVKHYEILGFEQLGKSRFWYLDTAYEYNNREGYSSIP